MAECICPRTDGYRIKRRGCAVHAETDAAYWQESDRRKFGTDVPHEPTDEFVVQAFAGGARSLWPDSRDPGWHVTFQRWLAARDARISAEALREAADRIVEFQKWYPTSVFPSLDEVLSDDYTPTSEQVAAQAYRHAYGELVPRNLRTWAREAIDGSGCDNCGGWECDCDVNYPSGQGVSDA